MRRFAWLSTLSAALTFPLISLGAIVRLKGAGLACPDWPLCYGEVTPLTEVIAPAPAGVGIALEVGHRYVAGILGLMILALCVWAWVKFRHHKPVVFWSTAALAILLPQALLGGLTVLFKLAPWTVSLHLVFGNLLWASLIALTIRSFQASRREQVERPERLPLFSKLAVGAWVLTFAQIFMGGLVSSTGASMACSGFPLCEGGALAPAAGASNLVVLQMLHRGVGFSLCAFLIVLAVVAWRAEGVPKRLKAGAGSLVLLVVLQILVGWYNVAHYVPVPSSALHTATAATIVGVATWTAIRALSLAATMPIADLKERRSQVSSAVAGAVGGGS